MTKINSELDAITINKCMSSNNDLDRIDKSLGTDSKRLM